MPASVHLPHGRCIPELIMDNSVGDQHKPNSGASTNPFEEEQPRISEYTAQEIATLQSRLDKQLGPEYISSRPGAGGQKVHYLAAEKVINLANEVFGFNGWSSAIKVITIDFIDENPHNGKISLGLSVTVRVTLRDGTYHEDIGYGHIENCKGKAAAFEKAKKEGTTDGLKRALRTFGNVLGNCIYDKDFLGKVTKIKVAPSRWDADNLHRHPDFAPLKKEPLQEDGKGKASLENGDISHAEGDDEFGCADFSDADFSESNTGHPDEVVLPAEPQLAPPPVRPPARTHGANQPLPPQIKPSAQQNNGMATPSRPPQARMAAPSIENRAQPPPAQRNPPHEQRPLPAQQNDSTKANSSAVIPNPPQTSSGTYSSSPGHTSQHFATGPQPGPGQPQQQNPQPPNQPHIPPVGFYSARVATTLNNASEGPAPAVPQFNPHSESPSIRKTVGIDHSRSIPVKRAAMGVAETAIIPLPGTREGMPAPPAPVRDFVNPSADVHRRIGAPPGGMHSPMAKGGMNGSAYRPPTRRGPVDGGPGANGGIGGAQGQGHVPVQGQPQGIKRPPLGDVSNMHPSNAGAGQGAGGGGPDDVKRQRTAGPENVGPTPQQNLPGAR
jgi:DNA repair and recombination protein RAD52